MCEYDVARRLKGIDQGRRYQRRLGDVAAGSGDRLVLAGFQIECGHMGQNSLASQTTTADALALLRHDRGPLRGGGIGQNKSSGAAKAVRFRLKGRKTCSVQTSVDRRPDPRIRTEEVERGPTRRRRI